MRGGRTSPSGPNICLLFGGFSEEHVQSIRRVAPTATIVRSSPERVTQEIQQADIAVGWLRMEGLEVARRLKWIHLPDAGADIVMETPFIQERGIVVTNSSGAFGVPISEHVLAMMLAFARRMRTFDRAQTSKEWRKGLPVDELFEKRVGILGLGDIGTEVARRCHAFGMRVVAMKRRPGQKPPFVDELYGPDGIDRVVATSDFLVVSLPGTAETTGLLSRERLCMMRPGSYLFNIGRGKVVEEEAMIDLLRSGHLAGAGLDVFVTEPLPPDNPLWEMENVIVTPHTSGTHPRHAERTAAIFCRNLERFQRSEPLENVLDLDLGY